MKNKVKVSLLLMLATCLNGFAQQVTPHANRLLSNTIDVSEDFSDFTNLYFFADSLSSFDGQTGAGTVKWKRYNIVTRQAFNTNTILAQPMSMLDFPSTEYEESPELKFTLDFISDNAVRMRMLTSKIAPKQEDEVMLVKQPVAKSHWKLTQTSNAYIYTSPNGNRLVIERYPWRVVLYDASGKMLTNTRRWCDNDSTQVKVLPFNFIRRGEDNSRSLNPVFSLKPNEQIVGCGESFTSMNKAGQKLNLFVTDPQGPETPDMYKPVPFFMSSRGYGMFMHTSAPVTCDFGASYVGATKLFMKDETLDFFLFWGTPKTILNEYTDFVGKPSMPPLWSFGTWMSRITYFSQDEGLDVAAQLRKHKIPSDVIHFDTGWFETDWQCDYQFSKNRFKDPQSMIEQLKKDGFHISLWQLPYFTPHNRYYQEIIDKSLCVKNANGTLPYEDAVLDFSNPATVEWYQGKIASLLKMGVGAIKVDFGEGAPLDGFYASGKGGLYEHNLYPVRYNKAVADITEKEHGEHIIWARSAWAGSQRYPLHWGGDAANTDMGMLASLRGGLSFGLSGFSFWSHDMGGFVVQSPEDLYRRWLPFGFLTSHTRAHGAPPTEPWLYNASFVEAFRSSAELKYKLMPYVYAQAKDCTLRGLPMVRALCVEYPDDKAVWGIDDEYLFGQDILVAPLFESSEGRDVYLPGGKWIDYQTGKVYSKGWNHIQAGKIPVVMLVRDGALVPHIKLAQSTDKMDWSKIELKAYYADVTTLKGLVCLPSDQILHTVNATVQNGEVKMTGECSISSSVVVKVK